MTCLEGEGMAKELIKRTQGRRRRKELPRNPGGRAIKKKHPLAHATRPCHALGTGHGCDTSGRLSLDTLGL